MHGEKKDFSGKISGGCFRDLKYVKLSVNDLFLEVVQEEMKKLRSYLLIAVFILTGILNVGAILKREDRIAQTQTDPILYEQKMEEIKDGEKGPSMPAIEYYKGAGFLTTAPVKGLEASDLRDAFAQPHELWEVFPAGTAGTAEDSFNEYWWLEEETPGAVVPDKPEAPSLREDKGPDDDDYWFVDN